MINNCVLEGFIRTLEEKSNNYGVLAYLDSIKDYWEKKRKKEKVKKPEPMFTEPFIKEIKRLKELIDYYSGTVTVDKKLLKRHSELSNNFIQAWKLYKQSTF